MCFLEAYHRFFVSQFTEYGITPSTEDIRDILSTVFTDATFRCPTYEASLIIDEKTDKLYVYKLTQTDQKVAEAMSLALEANRDIERCHDRVCHSADLVYLFQPNVNTWDTDALTLSNQMIEYWGNFAANQHPGIPTLIPSRLPPFFSKNKTKK